MDITITLRRWELVEERKIALPVKGCIMVYAGKEA